MATVIDSSTLHETSTRRFDGRAVGVGLSNRIGGAAPMAGHGAERQDPPPGDPGRDRQGPNTFRAVPRTGASA